MEFEDRDAFEAWLKGQPTEVCVAIAARAALRVWPVVLAEDRWKDRQTQAKVALRCGCALIIASLAAQASSDAILDRAYAAAAAAATTTNAAYHDAAAKAVKAVEGVYAAHAADAAYRDADFDAETMLRQDLWHKRDWPEALDPAKLGPSLLDDADFAFLRRWFFAMAEGKPLPIDLMTRIALEIKQDVWNSGDPKAVAAAIEAIETDYLSQKTRLAERIELNPETNRFYATPIPMQNAAFMSALMARTADALDDALHGGNGLREDMREVRVLRRTHERYANDPQRVEMDYTSVAVSLRRNLDVGELQTSDDNLALLEAVEEGARGLRAHHPEVAENRNSLAGQIIKELPEDSIALLEDAAETLPEITEGVMQEDFERDIPKLINDATLPLPSGAPPLPGADEATRIFGRVSRVKLLYEKMSEKGAAIFDSKGFKTVRLGLTLSSLLSALVTLGLYIFGVL